MVIYHSVDISFLNGGAMHHRIIRAISIAVIIVAVGFLGYVAYSKATTPRPTVPVVAAFHPSTEQPQVVRTAKPAATRAPQPTPAVTRPVPTPAPQATPQPTSRPTPTPTATACKSLYCNPWGYNFLCCNNIDNPPTNFCAYFPCTQNFWNGTGAVVECKDGKYAKDYGDPFSCAGYGGDSRLLYAP